MFFLQCSTGSVLPEHPGILVEEGMKSDGNVQTKRVPGLVQIIENGRVFSKVHRHPSDAS